MSLQSIYAHKTIGITDLKRGDTAFIESLDEPVAVLKRDSIKAYLIPEKLMAYFMDLVEDLKLAKEVNKRLKDLEDGKTTSIKVDIDDLYLEFETKAKKEWDKLDNTVKSAFKETLRRRLENPIVVKDRLHGTGKHECYKIKLRTLGFRLVYKVDRNKIILLVISIGKRENDAAYNVMHERLKDI